MLLLQLMRVRVHRVRAEAQLPRYHTAMAAGFDLCAAVETRIEAGEMAKIPTGLAFETPEGYALILASRSSAPARFGISPPHGIGVVDADYRGAKDEVCILVRNFTDSAVEIPAGTRVAQGLFVPVARAEFLEADLSENQARGGFGSTG